MISPIVREDIFVLKIGLILSFLHFCAPDVKVNRLNGVFFSFINTKTDPPNVYKNEAC